jgi:hypothetical protein
MIALHAIANRHQHLTHDTPSSDPMRRTPARRLSILQ